MRVLGLETTCDETSASIVELSPDGARRILSNRIRSQNDEHRPFGGVVPEIAARAHVEVLDGMIREAMAEAKVGFADIDDQLAAFAAVTRQNFLGDDAGLCGQIEKRLAVFIAVGGNKGQYKQVVVPVSQIQQLDSEVQRALGSVALTKGVATMTAEDIELTPGPLQSERAMLLAGIADLEQMGVGTAAFINALMAIEQKVKDQNTATLAKDIQSLNTSIETQKETYKAAKNSKPLHAKEDPHAAANLESLKTNSKGSINRWALQFFPLPETDILKDPNGFLAASKKQFEDKIGGKKAEEQSQFAWALLWFAEVLKNNGRAGEAASFERQAATVTAAIQAKAKK